MVKNEKKIKNLTSRKYTFKKSLFLKKIYISYFPLHQESRKTNFMILGAIND